MPVNVKAIMQRGEDLKSARSGNWDSHWQELTDFLRPGGTPFQETLTPGAKRRHRVFDNTGENAAELFSAALNGMVLSEQMTDFAFHPHKEALRDRDDVSVWFENAVGRMRAVFRSPISQFILNTQLTFSDVTTYGTSGMFCGDRPGNLPLYLNRPLSELYMGENDEGAIDTVGRWFKRSARQAVAQWGDAAGPEAVKAASSPSKQDQPIDFLHLTYPRTDRVPGVLVSSNLPVASVWINASEKHLIRESGFHEMPWMTPRFSKTSGETYGRGPGMKALPDVKMLQRSMKVMIRGAEKVVDPSYLVADDGVSSPIRFTSNGLNYVRSDLMTGRGDAIRPVQSGSRPDLAEDFMQGTRDRIDTTFYRQLLNIARDPRMTATQFIETLEETLRILGPIIGRLRMEFLTPLIERTFGIMLRGGMFMPLPEILSGEKFEVVYTNPIARAQQLAEARGIAQTNEIMAPVAAVDPSIMDNLDGDRAYRHVADLFGVPMKVMRPTERVIAMREARQEAAEAQAAEDSIVALAGAAGQASPLLQAGAAGNA